MMMPVSLLSVLLPTLTLTSASILHRSPGLGQAQVNLAEPLGYNTPVPYPNSTWGSVKLLFKRTCFFEENGNYCDGDGALCCYKLRGDEGFCCGGGNFGTCCGDTCCPLGQYCAYADPYVGKPLLLFASPPSQKKK